MAWVAARREVTVQPIEGEPYQLGYDVLVLAGGALAPVLQLAGVLATAALVVLLVRR